ncbi:MAG: squalene/phytoene synthase family protein [Acidobacteria bacterium]|nr:squalene/phytoene synthase family protein [Acidobacteriota bacterium]
MATLAHGEAESSADFCWRVLAAVSRSFAVVIRELPPPLNEAVMLSYLLCRIADSFEDSSLRLAERRAQLLRLPLFLTRESKAEDFPVESVPGVYRELMSRPDAVFERYRGLDSAAQTAIHACVAEMCEGMSEWTGSTIETIEHQNRYCYYVAGVVGQLLTELFHIYGMVRRAVRDRLMQHAVPFGLALQKINILRDVRQDMHEGRCYWPEQLLLRHHTNREQLLIPGRSEPALAVIEELVQDVVPYCGRALRYIELLPAGQFRLRSFCAIPLFMATATARACRGNPDVVLADAPVKISRSEARHIVLRSRTMAWCNPYLRHWYGQDLKSLTNGAPQL